MDTVIAMALPEDSEPSDDKATLTTTRHEKRLSKRERRRKAESSNAAVCPDFDFAKLNPAQQGGRQPHGVRQLPALHLRGERCLVADCGAHIRVPQPR